MQTNLQRGRVQSANRNLDTLVSTIPSKDETKSDISVLISSLRTLIILLFTSTAFRDILSNVLAVTREFVADTAHGVSESAAVVEELALKLEADARPGGSGCEDSPSPLHGYHDHDSAVKNTPRTKVIILDRMEDVRVSFTQAINYLQQCTGNNTGARRTNTCRIFARNCFPVQKVFTSHSNCLVGHI